MLLNIVLLGIGCAFAGVVFAEVRPFWFGWWYYFLLWAEGLGGLAAKLTKPLGGCAMCTAGFLCMVLSIATGPLNIVSHIIAPSIAIIAASWLENQYHAWNNQ